MNWKIVSTLKYRMDEWESACSTNDIHVAVAGTGAGAGAGARMSDALISCLAHTSCTAQHSAVSPLE